MAVKKKTHKFEIGSRVEVNGKQGTVSGVYIYKGVYEYAIKGVGWAEEDKIIFISKK